MFVFLQLKHSLLATPDSREADELLKILNSPKFEVRMSACACSCSYSCSVVIFVPSSLSCPARPSRVLEIFVDPTSAS